MSCGSFFMEKCSILKVIPVFFLIFLFLPSPLSAQTKRLNETGKVKGFSDALRQIQQERNQVQNQQWQNSVDDWTQLITLKSQILDELKKHEQELLQKAKDRFAHFTDQIIAHLNKVKDRINNSPDLDPATIAEITALIDQQISWLTGKKTEIEQAQTIEELQTIIGEIRNYWEENKVRIEIVVARLQIAKLESALAKIETFFSKAEEEIQELKNPGYDTSAVESLLEQARNDFADAKQELEQAKTLLTSAKTQEDLNNTRNHLEQTIKYLKSMAEKLKEVFKLLITPTGRPLPTRLPKRWPTGFPTGFPTGLPHPTISSIPNEPDWPFNR